MLTINQPVPAIQYPTPQESDLFNAWVKSLALMTLYISTERVIKMIGLISNGLNASVDIAPISPRTVSYTHLTLPTIYSV